MAVIEKEQDKAAIAKPVTTSGVNKDQRKYKPEIPMSTEGTTLEAKSRECYCFMPVTKKSRPSLQP
eukprot:8269388-Ditylum_brightwellii.AAC.1